MEEGTKGDCTEWTGQHGCAAACKAHDRGEEH
jgi:hypothetical protein